MVLAMSIAFWSLITSGLAFMQAFRCQRVINARRNGEPVNETSGPARYASRFQVGLYLAIGTVAMTIALFQAT